MSVGNTCQEITCSKNTECAPYKSQCDAKGKGATICRTVARICGCSKETVSGFNEDVNNCNKYKQRNGKTNCKAGDVCTRAGFCIKNPLCSERAEKCGVNKRCCAGLFCHSRLATPKTTECYRVAYPGEKCAVAHGIPCVAGSECLATTKVCSKRK
ncbi:hypothetical protein INT47_012873 [Mucor saturninus]|uniref:Uncharacterized protein n=1 Tax=Mucor saturninus TaxID=64648 RepID=A0A8H7QWP8_9FUNG|nr:hypothetical protein INT47_012873 [Mucor saturninus]